MATPSYHSIRTPDDLRSATETPEFIVEMAAAGAPDDLRSATETPEFIVEMAAAGAERSASDLNISRASVQSTAINRSSRDMFNVCSITVELMGSASQNHT